MKLLKLLIGSLVFCFMISGNAFALEKLNVEQSLVQPNCVTEAQSAISALYADVDRSKPLELTVNTCQFKLKPLKPLGCTNGVAICQCSGNNCDWVWQCY